MVIKKDKFILTFVCFLVLFSVVFLVGPRVADERQKEKCVVNIDLPFVFGFSMDCDSPEFLRLAMNPSCLLEYKNIRQSRPGSIIASYIISYPFRPFISILGSIEMGVNKEEPDRWNNVFEYYIPAFLAYAISNIIIIIISLFLILSIWVEKKREINAIYIFPALFLFVNIIFPRFFWSPHNQFFNVLVPIFCVWLAYLIWERGLFEKSSIYLYSLLAGVGATFYATFFLCIPVIMVTSFLKKKNLKDYLIRNSIILFLIIIPMLSWIVFVKLKTGNYYSYDGRILVWIINENIAGFIVIFFKNIFSFWKLFFKEFYLFLLFLFGFTIFVSKDFFIKNKDILIITILVSVLFSLFFSLMGNIVTRIAFSLLPPLYIVLGLVIDNIYQKVKNKSILLGFVILFLIINILALFK